MKYEGEIMGLFINPRRNKEKWASIVIANYKKGMNVAVKVLDEATDAYIKQHARILYDSIHIVLTSSNAETQKERYKLANSHYGSLTKVYRYGTKEQKAAIRLAESDFFKMEEWYKHPERVQIVSSKKGMKDAFWEVYGEAEALDIFSGKKK